MISPHVARGRSNLAASAVYLMRAIGMSAFQTSLLPKLSPDLVQQLNQCPVADLLMDSRIAAEAEIDRAIWVAKGIGRVGSHRIHYAANLFEVMLNVKSWNEEISREKGMKAWGKRTVTFFVHDPREGTFAPSKFCAFVPLYPVRSAEALSVSMTMDLYASLDEAESRFDGNLARSHLRRRLSMVEAPLAADTTEMRRDFSNWYRRGSTSITLHPRGPLILLPPQWW